MTVFNSIQSDFNCIYQQLERKFIQADLRCWGSIQEAKWEISEVPRRILRAFEKNLQELDLSRLNLNSLPNSIGQLSQLQKLNLNYNCIQFLPEFFEQLSQTRELYLSNNRLEFLQESFGQLSQLQTLDLSRNQLTSLPISFGKIVQLQHLYLSCNRLTSLSESFGQLSHLQELHLTDNLFQLLPESLVQLPELQTLKFSNNQLESLPMSLAHCRKSITYLNLKANKNLKKLPPSFEFLYLIEEIIISRTNISPAEVAVLKNKWAAVNKVDAIQLLHIR